MQEIGIDYFVDGELNENGDTVYIAKGINGILYRLVKCRHNPTHTNTYPTTFDNEVVRFNFERTLIQTPNLNTKKNDDKNPDDLTELKHARFLCGPANFFLRFAFFRDNFAG